MVRNEDRIKGRELVRKTMALIAWVVLATMWTLTLRAVYGSPALPARVPTHFDAAGNINAWGEPGMFWLLPIAAAFLVVLVTLAGRYPALFNFSVRATPITRPRLEAISQSMIAWLRAELVCLFLWIQYATIESARTGRNTLSPVLLPVAIGLVFATVFAHMIASIRVARGSARS
jgi:uncharacterized membrane protein